jgi:hypothetical protein
MPKPEVGLSQAVRWPSCLRTCGRENHIGYLGRHFREVRHPNNAPLPISVPFDEISKDHLDCRFPDEGIIALGEAWRCDSSVLSPLIMPTDANIWTIKSLLTGF